MLRPTEGDEIRQNLIRSYNRIVGGVNNQAIGDQDRAYGGVIRSAKGKLVEGMAPYIVNLAWREAGGDVERLTFGTTKRYRVPIKSDYVNSLAPEIRNMIKVNKEQYYYNAQVDVHAFVDGNLVMGVECKAYAENAMLKRILVDFQLLKSMHTDLICCLLQLESQLGGDYSEPVKRTPNFGSRPSHTLMSYFPGVTLHILTLLEGERRVDRPIHKPEFFKEMKLERLDFVIEQFRSLLKPLL